MQRTRNHAGDQRTYRSQWIEEAWAKNPAWRQIVVRATNPDGRTVEVSILSDDRSRPAGEVVWLIFARKSKAGEIEKMIGETEQELENTSREVSRLDTLISREAVRLCGDRKRLMDVIKITARNLFYEVIAPFIEAYDNFRDDHVWFRHIVRSGGVLEELQDRSLRCTWSGSKKPRNPS